MLTKPKPDPEGPGSQPPNSQGMSGFRPSWKKTLHLPKSLFPARAVVADRPKYIQRCTSDLYQWQRGRQDPKQSPFILADGPPYANGSLHIGHALNKVLKDVVARYQVSEGRRVDWVPGWDCHGLPIELKALQEKGDQPTNAIMIRSAARKLATKTVKDQKEAFQQWGLMADWDNAWTTMDKEFEIKQLGVFMELLKKGLIYRQFKPVYWSPSSHTALAEAELEYRDDHLSTAAFVKYPLHGASKTFTEKFGFEMKSVNAVIWTTTPWTLPANRAIGLHKDNEYIVVKSSTHGRLLLAASRLSTLEHELKESLDVIFSIEGQELVGTSYKSPVFDTESPPRPFLHADFVSEVSGSGLVHVAPGHGMEDYQLCQKYNIPAFAPLDDKGCFTNVAYPEDAGFLSGKPVLSMGNQAVLARLSESGYLLSSHKYEHIYPYDWRSKQPVIVRATEQWFANVGNIQGEALVALDSVTFVPPNSKIRLQTFVRNRTEWCISRQRAWGVPIPALYHGETNEAVLTEHSVYHIISVIQERGIDAWWTDDELDPVWTHPSLRSSDGQTTYRRGKDTMDVWFDSGTSWTQTKQPPETISQIASCYIEGTDQHRGWFQSSLLTHVACHSKAPYETLITHGFTLDQDGRKMSKSIGNIVSPDEIMDGTLLPSTRRKINGRMTDIPAAMGPDALRLWVASCDYTTDVKVSVTVLQAINNNLSKYRVTFKLLLGILDDLDESSPFNKDLPLSKVNVIALWRLNNVVAEVRRHYRSFEFNKAVSLINTYINNDLSSFYFECIKDNAYCGIFDKRFQVQVTLYQILAALQQMLYPVTPLLIEEVWQYTPQQIKDIAGAPPGHRTWENVDFGRGNFGTELDEDIPRLMRAIAAVKSAQEVARTAKLMGNSLQSWVWLDPKSDETRDLFDRYSGVLETLFGVSSVTYGRMEAARLGGAGWSRSVDFDINGGRNHPVVAYVYKPQQAKCTRCWRYKAPVEVKESEALCERCEEVVADLKRTKPELFEEVQ